MNTEMITAKLLERWRAGDERAGDRLYATLKAKFLGVALRILRDEHEAQEAFDDSFMRLQSKVREGFEWQGEARFYSYFKQILHNICINYYRHDKPRREWEERHLVPSQEPIDEDGGSIERAERVADDAGDPYTQEVEAQRQRQFLEELAAFLQEALTPTEWLFWKAYYELVCTPGSGNWRNHQKTAFLKTWLAMPGTAFYAAHSRFKRKLEPFIGQSCKRRR